MFEVAQQVLRKTSLAASSGFSCSSCRKAATRWPRCVAALRCWIISSAAGRTATMVGSTVSASHLNNTG